VRLVYLRRFTSKGQALRHEIAVKSFTHAQKDTLSRRWWNKKA
jgi:predicted GIY-YIG superfamily endonuclease